MSRCFYVYLLYVDGVLRYVGKGSGDRVFRHLDQAHRLLRKITAGSKVRTTHFYNRLVNAIILGAEIEERLLEAGKTESEASSLERSCIAYFGRVGLETGGVLWNTLDGGEGITSADARRFNSDPEFHRKISEGVRRSITTEVLKRLRLQAKTIGTNPRIRAIRSSTMKRFRANPAFEANRRAKLKEYNDGRKARRLVA